MCLHVHSQLWILWKSMQLFQKGALQIWQEYFLPILYKAVFFMKPLHLQKLADTLHKNIGTWYRKHDFSKSIFTCIMVSLLWMFTYRSPSQTCLKNSKCTNFSRRWSLISMFLHMSHQLWQQWECRYKNLKRIGSLPLRVYTWVINIDISENAYQQISQE